MPDIQSNNRIFKRRMLFSISAGSPLISAQMSQQLANGNGRKWYHFLHIEPFRLDYVIKCNGWRQCDGESQKTSSIGLFRIGGAISRAIILYAYGTARCRLYCLFLCVLKRSVEQGYLKSLSSMALPCRWLWQGGNHLSPSPTTIERGAPFFDWRRWLCCYTAKAKNKRMNWTRSSLIIPEDVPMGFLCL